MSGEEQGCNTNSFMPLNVLAMQIQGLLPVSSFGPFLAFGHQILGLLILFCIILCTVAMYVDLVKTWGDLDAMISNASITLLFTACTVRVIVFFFTRGTMINLVAHINKVVAGIHESGDERAVNILNRYKRYFNLINKSFWIGVNACITGYCCAPFVDTIRGNNPQLIYRAWSPFSNFWYGYWLQFVFAYPMGVVNSAWVTFTAGLIIFPACELKVLYLELQHSMDSYENETLLKMKISDWVQKHYAVINYIESLNGVMNHLILLDFMIYSTMFCAISVQCSIMGLQFKNWWTMLYMQVMLLQMILVYWNGNEIIVHSEELAKAAFNSAWYRAPKSYATSIQIMIHRFRLPLKLRAWKFYNVSMETCLQIITTAYSYFAIVRQMYSDK